METTKLVNQIEKLVKDWASETIELNNSVILDNGDEITSVDTLVAYGLDGDYYLDTLNADELYDIRTEIEDTVTAYEKTFERCQSY